MESRNLPRDMASYDFADSVTGEQLAVFDLAWPAGIQENLSQPTAVLLNEDPAVLAVASRAGFRYFTSVADFQQYVTAEVLAEKVA